MTSYSGSVAYLEYVSLTNKGNVRARETMFNSVFGHGDMNDDRMNFTSQVIIENESNLADLAFAKETVDGQQVTTVKDYGFTYIDKATNATCHATYKFIGKDANGNRVEKYGETAPDDITVEKIAYVLKKFQMEQVPANEIPAIGPVMKHIPLVAEPRRIAVRYDQITAFQAKTDYGFSLDKQIAEQACGELAYEIDTEIVAMLKDGAGAALTELTWSKTLPAGVSKFEHYNGFLEVVEMAKAIIYDRTKKFHPNYMVIASDVLPVLRFINGFTAVKNAKMNGPYKVGELDGMNVYVSPLMKNGNFFLGLNGNDMMSSAGVYAPYMAIVPTQLLGTPDGGMTQGFSTWYAKALLNENLLVAGQIVD